VQNESGHALQEKWRNDDDFVGRQECSEVPKKVNELKQTKANFGQNPHLCGYFCVLGNVQPRSMDIYSIEANVTCGLFFTVLIVVAKVDGAAFFMDFPCGIIGHRRKHAYAMAAIGHFNRERCCMRRDSAYFRIKIQRENQYFELIRISVHSISSAGWRILRHVAQTLMVFSANKILNELSNRLISRFAMVTADVSEKRLLPRWQE
jgi:hypothetical protein